MTYLPTAEQVAVAWAKTVDGIDPTKVATSLPADAEVWAATGFVTVSVAGGSPQTHTPLYGPVVRFDCWAANLGSVKPPWGRAGSMAEAIQFATYGFARLDVVPGPEFARARVLSVYPLGSPFRVPGDEAGFARVFIDLRLHWTVAPRPPEVLALYPSGSLYPSDSLYPGGA